MGRLGRDICKEFDWSIQKLLSSGFTTPPITKFPALDDMIQYTFSQQATQLQHQLAWTIWPILRKVPEIDVQLVRMQSRYHGLFFKLQSGIECK